jgi:hypothetical protein
MASKLAIEGGAPVRPTAAAAAAFTVHRRLTARNRAVLNCLNKKRLFRFVPR